MMVIETTYLVGIMEPLDETLRYYFATNWIPSETNNVTPAFISPHGYDMTPADFTKSLSESDIGYKKANGLLLFETTENIPLPSASNAYRLIESPVKITGYARSKYEAFLFIDHFNDIIQDNMPSTSFRIKKSDGIQDSAIAYFKNRKGVKFSQPLMKDNAGLLYIFTGSLSVMSIKTKTS